MKVIIILLVVVAVVVVLSRLTARGRKIASPRLGLLDLSGGKSEAIRAEDRAALADLFSSVEDSTDAVPKCDVLFLYATLGEVGALLGTKRYLRDTIRDSGAQIVVVASENPDPKPTPRSRNEARANLVITLERKGDRFTRFFRELFQRMRDGQTMPQAWVGIVPQGPSPTHDECPGTIFLMEAGPIRFG